MNSARGSCFSLTDDLFIYRQGVLSSDEVKVMAGQLIDDMMAIKKKHDESRLQNERALHASLSARKRQALDEKVRLKPVKHWRRTLLYCYCKDVSTYFFCFLPHGRIKDSTRPSKLH